MAPGPVDYFYYIFAFVGTRAPVPGTAPIAGRFDLISWRAGGNGVGGKIGGDRGRRSGGTADRGETDGWNYKIERTANRERESK